MEAVQMDFPDKDPQSVMKVLDEYGIRPHEQERERVQAGILMLSGGDIDKVREWVSIAKKDFRDVVIRAERLGPIFDLLMARNNRLV